MATEKSDSTAEPTQPVEPRPPEPDQTGPETVSPTGQATGAARARVAQSGAYLTTARGTRADLDGVRRVRQKILDAGMTPLVIAPTGGALDGDGDAVPVQRTYATARSVEFDALLFAGAPAAAADAFGARDATAGTPAPQAPDPRVLILLTEAYRHGKPLGGRHGAEGLLAAAAVDSSAPGIVLADDATDALDAVEAVLAQHRAWDRFPPAA
ncbi:hypothetical protein [Streptomyces erythrochromogenes]|uniref:hypothetical protein n=1 Tax=Streptomyces erythrochromogenes TaxID=285574 RepID=UPI0002E9575C